MTAKHLLILLAAAILTSCVQPQPYYPPAMSMAEWEVSERAVNRMEEDSFAFRHRERMSHAEATEMATRNNPTHVTTNRTSLWIW